MKKKLLSFIFAICLIIPCAFMLSACKKSKDNDNDNALTLAQVITICDSTFADLEAAKNLTTTTPSTVSDELVNNAQNLTSTTLLSASEEFADNAQSSPIGISYEDYSDTIPENSFGTAEDLIDMTEINYQIFKEKELYLGATFEYKMIGDDADEFWYIYLNISTTSKNQVRIQWAQTEDAKSSTYDKALLYQSMIINVDNNLNWTSIEINEFIEDSYSSGYPNATYYYIEKSTAATRQYDRYTEANTDYEYISEITGKTVEEIKEIESNM